MNTPLLRFALAIVAVMALCRGLQASPLYPNVVMADSPDAYWRLGETSGTTAVDQTGNHNGTYSGSYTLGQAGAIVADSNTAVDFSGGIVSAVGTGIGGATALSIELWATADSLPGYANLINRTSSVNWVDGYGIYTLNDQLHFFVNNYSTGKVSASFAVSSSYHHIVATFFGGQSGSNNVLSIYIDGVLAASANTANSVINYPGTGNLNLTIGGTPNGYAWDGKIDEVSVYSTVLTSGDVAEHYAAGIAAVPEPHYTWLMFGAGLAFFVAKVRKRKLAAARS